MGKDYGASHQYEPLRTPAEWTEEEKRLIVQLSQIFDDLYRRFNRLRFEDLGRPLQKRIEDLESGIAALAQKVK